MVPRPVSWQNEPSWLWLALFHLLAVPLGSCLVWPPFPSSEHSRETLPRVLKLPGLEPPALADPWGILSRWSKHFSLPRRALQESLLASGGNNPPLRGSSTFDRELQLAMALSLQEQQEREQRRQEEEEEELKEALQRSLLEK